METGVHALWMSFSTVLLAILTACHSGRVSLPQNVHHLESNDLINGHGESLPCSFNKTLRSSIGNFEHADRASS